MVIILVSDKLLDEAVRKYNGAGALIAAIRERYGDDDSKTLNSDDVLLDMITNDKPFSYEIIRNVHTREKDDDIQRLPNGFKDSFFRWMKVKNEMRDTTSLLEVENSKKLIEDTLNRRMKKIVLMALELKFRHALIETKNLTDNECAWMSELNKLFKEYNW